MNVCDGNVAIVVTSLMTPQRAPWVDDMRKVVPELQVVKSINGFNKSEVESELLDSGLRFHRLCRGHENWGMLASLLTRHKAFSTQTADFQVLLEDDLKLHPNLFKPFIASMIEAHFCNGPPVKNQVCKQGPQVIHCFGRRHPNIVQMDRFGEAYLTDRAGARALSNKLKTYGIRGCSDQMYNVGEIMNESHVYSTRRRPWQLLVHTNRGDIHKTSRIRLNEMAWMKKQTQRYRTRPRVSPKATMNGATAL